MKHNKIVDNEIFDSFKNDDKTSIKKLIDDNPDVISKQQILKYITNCKLDTTKFVFEYYEKINKKIVFDCVHYGLTNIKKDKTLDYLKYLKKHNYNTYNNERKDTMIYFFCISIEYITKTNICNYMQCKITNYYICNNTIVPEEYSNHIFRFNYVIYVS